MCMQILIYYVVPSSFYEDFAWSTDLLGFVVPCEKPRAKPGCKQNFALRKSDLWDSVTQAVVRLNISVLV